MYDSVASLMCEYVWCDNKRWNWMRTETSVTVINSTKFCLCHYDVAVYYVKYAHRYVLSSQIESIDLAIKSFIFRIRLHQSVICSIQLNNNFIFAYPYLHIQCFFENLLGWVSVFPKKKSASINFLSIVQFQLDFLSFGFNRLSFSCMNFNQNANWIESN